MATRLNLEEQLLFAGLRPILKAYTPIRQGGLCGPEVWVRPPQIKFYPEEQLLFAGPHPIFYPSGFFRRGHYRCVPLGVNIWGHPLAQCRARVKWGAQAKFWGDAARYTHTHTHTHPPSHTHPPTHTHAHTYIHTPTHFHFYIRDGRVFFLFFQKLETEKSDISLRLSLSDNSEVAFWHNGIEETKLLFLTFSLKKSWNYVFESKSNYRFWEQTFNSIQAVNLNWVTSLISNANLIFFFISQRYNLNLKLIPKNKMIYILRIVILKLFWRVIEDW
jgi:hypothetical protein